MASTGCLQYGVFCLVGSEVVNQAIAGCRLSTSSRFRWVSMLLCELILVYILVVSWVFKKARYAERVPFRDLCRYRK